MVNVFNPDKHESVADVTKADIIGGVDSVTGKDRSDGGSEGIFNRRNNAY